MNPYNAEYYENQLGPIPCSWDSTEWLSLNSGFADEIIKRLKPLAVLDVGCSIGLLVGAMQHRGIEAMGLDGSEYAISVAKQHCAPGTVFWMPLQLVFPYQWDYKPDVVTCIEVAEHIELHAIESAMLNLCKISQKYIIFSSTPDDFDEPTHVNVQPEEYWLNKFSQHGFELKERAPWLTPQALILEKVK